MANHELDLLYVTNPTDRSKTVKWGGIDYTLGPGQQIIWQRFLAEHFAKHLANDILLLKEKAHKDAYLAKGGHLTDYKSVAYLNSKKHRPPVVASILTGTYSYHQAQRAVDPNLAAQQEIERINREANGVKEPEATNLGVLNDNRTAMEGKTEFDASDEDDAAIAEAAADGQTLVGPPPPMAPPAAASPMVGQPTIPPMTAPAVPPAQPQTVAQTPPQTSQQAPGLTDDMKKPALMAEAKKLGITVPFGSTNDQIKQLIAQNFG